MEISYTQLLDELIQISSTASNKNTKNIVATKLKYLGVYVPKLKEIAKKYSDYNFVDFKFNEYYEINFIFAYANLYKLRKNIDEQINFIFKYDYIFECWAIVDSCAPLLKDSTIEISKKLIKSNKEFIIRFAYVILLSKVRNRMMINEAFNIIIKDKRYYVIMAEGWLISECLISDFEKSFNLLKDCKIDQNVQLIAIQKAIDSYRVTNENKDKLREYRKLLRGNKNDK